MKMYQSFRALFFTITLLITVMPVIASAGAPPPELKIGGFLAGPQAWSFNRYSFFEAVEKTKEVGCNVIEAYPGQRLSPDDDTPFNHNASPSVWAKAKIKLEKTGVRMLSYGVIKFDNNETEARKVFDFAKIMGIPVISVEPAKDSFDLLEKLVKEYDIKLAIHNHPRKPDNPDYKYWDPNYVLEVVKDRDPRIGACADTGHWVRSNVNPLDALKILEGRIISSHLKDLDKLGRESHSVPYGKGVVDIGAILGELKRQRFEGNVSIEYEYNWTTSIPEIKECVDFIREWGKNNQ